LAGSFAVRWEYVLRRMDGANVDALVHKIRGQIKVLNEAKGDAHADGKEVDAKKAPVVLASLSAS